MKNGDRTGHGEAKKKPVWLVAMGAICIQENGLSSIVDGEYPPYIGGSSSFFGCFSLKSFIPHAALIAMSFHLRYPFFAAALAIRIGGAAALGVGNATAPADGYASPWVAEPNGRGTLTIVWSSTLTLFLSAWMTLHLNIPRYNETRPRMWLRWAGWGFISFIFPEFIIFLAFSQWQHVRRFRRKLNTLEQQSRSEDPALKLSHEHRSSTPFSLLYAWYAYMGGFCVPIVAADEMRRVTISLDGILELAGHGHFLYMDDHSISDKSKADYLAKSLVCVQVSWFVCQAIQRKVAGLPISLLEFHVLVNIGCGLIIYAFWLTKPRSIETATLIDISSVHDDLGSSMLTRTNFRSKIVHDETDDELWLCSERDIRKSERYYTYSQRAIISISEGEKRVVVCAAGQADISADSRPFARQLKVCLQLPPDKSEAETLPNEGVMMPQNLIVSTQVAYNGSPWPQPDFAPASGKEPRVFSAIRLSHKIHEPKVPNFDFDIFLVLREDNSSVTTRQDVEDTLMLASMSLVISVYGVLHLIPDLLDFTFPTSPERMIWRVSCYIIISFLGASCLLIAFLWVFDEGIDSIGPHTRWAVMSVLFGYAFTLLVARLYLMVEAYISLRKERVEIFQTPGWNWLDYIPHI